MAQVLAAGDRLGIVTLWDVAHRSRINRLKGQAQRVYCVAFSPDGTRLATGSADGTVKLWNAATGDELITLRGHSGLVFTVEFSRDGMTLVSASDDNTVKVWRRASQKDVWAMEKQIKTEEIAPTTCQRIESSS